MAVITAAIIAMLVGAGFRIVWSRLFMNKKLYYVPPALVLLVMAGCMLFDPRSGVFVLGVFLFDLIYFLLKDEPEKKAHYQKLLNMLLDKGEDEVKN